MEKKEFLFDIKKLSDDGELSGYAAVFGIVDLGGDIIERGAFKQTIKEHDGVFPMTWYHDVRDPIGAVKVREDEHGLFIKGRLNLAVQSAKEKHALMKQGVIKALSFGFDTVKHEWDEIGKQTIRHLKEVKLYEVAPVLFPMQLQAQITDVKSFEDGSVGA
ncbi:MAG TPA: HK97 family phage prohead protease, partial [Candidatus Aminicenantes bacterium]|nr:HK97 family phage prohead protease [Candidatus Aminicenantes bacterium]